MKLKTLVMLGLTSLPLSAVADTVVLTGFTYEPAVSVTVANPAYSGLAGQFTGTLNGDAFTTFCAEIGESINFGNSYEYTVVDGATAWGADKADLLAKLLTYYAGFNWPSSAFNSAVIQVLIWEIIYEDAANGYFVQSGDFIVDNVNGVPIFDPTDNAEFLASVVPIFDVDLLANDGAQNLLLIRRVPEPATLALMGLGLLGIGLRARRRAN